jgi:hypothetical protein
MPLHGMKATGLLASSVDLLPERVESGSCEPSYLWFS